MLDKDRDGIITKGDLSGMLASLGNAENQVHDFNI